MKSGILPIALLPLAVGIVVLGSCGSRDSAPVIAEQRQRESTPEPTGRESAPLARAAPTTIPVPTSTISSPDLPEAAQSAEPSEEFGRVAGQVIGQAGEPVVNAEAIFLRQGSSDIRQFAWRGRYRDGEPHAVTDASGEFLASQLFPGEYTIAWRAPGYIYRAYDDPVEVRAGETSRGIVQSLEKAGVITGEVVENFTGKLIAGAKVSGQVVSENRHSGALLVVHGKVSTFAGEDGKFRLDVLLPYEEYDLTAEHDRFATGEKEKVPVDAGEPVRIVLSPGGAVDGRVIDKESRASVEGAKVSAYMERSKVKEVKSATDGRFLIEGLDPGRYRFHAEKSKFFSKRLPDYELKVGLVQRRSLELALVRGAVIELRVIDQKTHEPITGAEVEFRNYPEKLFTDEAGKVLASGFDEGRVRYTVKADGYAPKTDNAAQWIDVHLEQTTRETIEMEPEQFLFGIVVDEQEEPVSGAEVKIESKWLDSRTGMGGRWPPAITDENGRFQLEGLEEANYSLIAVKEGYAIARGYGKAGDQKEIKMELRAGATLEGTVKNAQGQALEGFTVKLETGQHVGTMKSAVSDTEGCWKVTQIEEGVYTVYAQKGNKRTKDLNELKISRNDHIRGITLVLKEGLSVGGKLVDFRELKGLPEMDLILIKTSEFWHVSDYMNAFYLATTTGYSGEFVFENVPPGHYIIKMGKNPYQDELPAPYIGLTWQEQVRVNVQDQDITDLLVKLRKGATVKGRVLLPSGEGAYRAQLSVLHEDHMLSNQARNVKTAAKGEFEITGIHAAKGYRVQAKLASYGPALSEVLDLKGGDVVENLVLRLQVAGSLSGSIKDDQGKPLSEGYYVTANFIGSPQFGGGGIGRGNPDDSGHYRISDVPPGEIRVQLWVEGPGLHGGRVWRPRETKMVEIVSGEETTGVDFVVPSKKKEKLTGHIAGRVVDSKGEGIEGMRVLVFAQAVEQEEGRTRNAVTNPDGTFRIEGLVKGPYYLSVDGSGYDGKHIKVTSPSDNVEVVLPRLGWIEGRVVHRDTGEPVTSYFLTHFTSHMWAKAKVPITDPEGRFQLEDVQAGTQVFQVEAEGIGTAQARVELSEGEEIRDLIVEVPSPYRLHGWVIRKSDQAPVEGARVKPASLNRPVSGGSQRITGTKGQEITGADGRFTISGLYPGPEMLIVDHPDYGTVQFSDIEVPESETDKEVILELKEPGRIEGYVYDSYGDPAEDAALRMIPEPGGDAADLGAKADHEGFYAFPPLPPGKYTISWRIEHFPGIHHGNWSQKVEIKSGQTEVVSFGDGPAVVTGVVTKGGEPRHLAVVAFETDSVEMRVQVDRDGKYRVGGLRAGSYTVTLTNPGDRKKIFARRDLELLGQEEVRLDLSYPE